MEKLTILNEGNIKDRIHILRGLQIILDRDIATLYNIETRALKQAVNRNPGRFPEDFMIKLSEKDVELMVSQNVIPSKKHLGGSIPYAFTEQGVANLASILTSDKAIAINIQIMRAFVAMRKFISYNAQIFQRLDRVEIKQLEHDKRFEEVFDAIQDKQLPKKGIFFDGQVFDAYTFVSDIIRSAKRSIILIDNYVDDSVLTLFSKRDEKVEVVIYTRMSRQLTLDLMKHNSQYSPIVIKEFSKSHDRFLIIDEKVYHFGASLKDLGKKWFAFSRMDKESLKMVERLG